jgi:hypothetical protein
LSSRFLGHLAFCVTICVATAGSLAAYSASAIRTTLPPDLAINTFAIEPQVSNRSAKASRLAALRPTRLASIDERAAFALISAEPAAETERTEPAAIAAAPMIASKPPQPALVAPPAAEPKHAAVVAAPLPNENPKHLLPPHSSAPAATNLFDDGQIAGLKGRLRLTSDQVEYWPAVEAALRDVVRTQLRGSVRAGHGRVNIDINSPEVQKLIWAVMPLLMRLREDQKSEVRKLARVIGLDQVASQI